MQRIEVKTDLTHYKYEGDDIEYRVDGEGKLIIIVYKGAERRRITVAEYQTWEHYLWSEVEEEKNNEG